MTRASGRRQRAFHGKGGGGGRRRKHIDKTLGEIGSCLLCTATGFRSLPSSWSTHHRVPLFRTSGQTQCRYRLQACGWETHCLRRYPFHTYILKQHSAVGPRLRPTASSIILTCLGERAFYSQFTAGQTGRIFLRITQTLRYISKDLE